MNNKLGIATLSAALTLGGLGCHPDQQSEEDARIARCASPLRNDPRVAQILTSDRDEAVERCTECLSRDTRDWVLYTLTMTPEEREAALRLELFYASNDPGDPEFWSSRDAVADAHETYACMDRIYRPELAE